MAGHVDSPSTPKCEIGVCSIDPTALEAPTRSGTSSQSEETLCNSPEQSHTHYLTSVKSHSSTTSNSHDEKKYETLTDNPPPSPKPVPLFGKPSLRSVLSALLSQLRTLRRAKSRRAVTLWLCFSAACFVFILNTLLTLLTYLLFSRDSDGVATLLSGNCAMVSGLDTFLHLLINMLSTVLLGASNLCLQLTFAPTRGEIDKAHRKGKWLDIGVPSVRNFFYISKKSRSLALGLILSSLPIHFLYNAAVFTSVSQNTFVWAVVTESFFRPESYPTIYIESNGTLFAEPKHFYNDEDLHPSLGVAWNGHIADPYHAAMVPFHNDALANLDTYTNMSSIDCIKAYSDMFSFRKNLLLVSRNIDVAIELNNTLLSRRSTRSDGIRWEYDQCRLDTELWGLEGDALVDMERYQTLNQSSIDIIEQGSEGFKIDYCLQQNSTLGEEDFQKCRLQVAPQLLLSVAIFNLCKCILILFVCLKTTETITTLGDAIASFLASPDPTTADMGVTSRATIQSMGTEWNKNGTAVAWKPKTTRWYHAVSRRRWISTNALLLVIVTMTILTLYTGVVGVEYNGVGLTPHGLTELGFGSTNVLELMYWNQEALGQKGLLSNVLLANMWQFLLSILYLGYNSVLSTLMVAEEWSSYARKRKALRVSHPTAHQRSTYTISMPLKFGLPVMLFFSFAHWLVSQSVFILRVNIVDTVALGGFGSTAPDGWTYTGFSLIPIFTVIPLIIFLFLLLLLTSLLRILHTGSGRTNPAMPLVSSCSAAISANCHRPKEDVDASFMPVKWGVYGSDEEGRALCAFTTWRGAEAPAVGSVVYGLEEPVVKKGWVRRRFSRAGSGERDGIWRRFSDKVGDRMQRWVNLASWKKGESEAVVSAVTEKVGKVRALPSPLNGDGKVNVGVTAAQVAKQ